jgi:hypothetical protein
MTVSTLAPTPEPVTGSGGAFVAFAQDFLGPVAKAAGVTLDPAKVYAEMLDRAARPDYTRWFDQLADCGHCARPVRIRGEIVERHRDGDRVIYSTADEPDGVLLIRCGNRRAAVCPSCAYEYAGDVWHLIYAGIQGGHKGVPEHVAEHPMVFASFTAGSFGPVHTTREDRRGKRARCRPWRDKKLCPHGRPTWCMKLHADDDLCLGEPLCPDCYDYTAAVAFNWYAPELWRRFTITLRRVLAKLLGVSASQLRQLVVPGYAKVAEFQRRGVVHFHAIIRLDGHGDDHPAPGISVTVEQLEEAIRQAAAHVTVTTERLLEDGRRLLLRFGEQIDVQPVRRRELQTGELQAEQVAAYIAKYATKAAEDLGLGERIPDLHHARYRDLTPHIARLVETAWQLGDANGFAGIRRWLHMLGFRGHFATKSRRYSTTLSALREVRRGFRRRQQAGIDPELLHDPTHDDDPDGDDTTLVIARWQFAGLGYATVGDAALAASAAARARERRQAARDELSIRVA